MATASNTQQARIVNTVDHGKLDVRALVLLAVLLAAGFILNFTVGKAMNVPQALVIGLISAAVIQITTTSPFIDFAAEGIAAMLMAVIVNAGMRGSAKKYVPAIGTFVTTVVSGCIFMVIKMAMLGVVAQLAAAMLPVVFATGVFNAILVQALYIPICKALKVSE